MGNTQTREQRPPPLPYPGSPSQSHDRYGSVDGGTPHLVRSTRSSHGNIFGRVTLREEPQDEAALAQRRLNKAEREVRKKEEKEAARKRERERSWNEESVDGGYLVSSGLYISDEDYNKSIVRQLMVARRLAPFYIGLEDHREDWAEHQLIAAVHGTPIPPADEAPAETPHWPPADGPAAAELSTDEQAAPSSPSSPPPNLSTSPLSTPTVLKGRTKSTALASSPTGDGLDLTQLESTLPPRACVNGQRLEVYLYKDPIECEICYRSLPPFINRSRCCDKPICSECFVSIKRKDPHPKETDIDSPPPRPVEDLNPESDFDLGDIDLVSEPAKCPFCKENEFGISYQPPPFRSGLVHASAKSAALEDMPIPPGLSSSPAGRPRAASLAVNASGVVSTDRIRPDWSKKLLQAKLNVAKRARAATALHQQAFLPQTTRTRIGLFRRGNSDSPSNSDGGQNEEGTVLDINRLIAAAADRRGVGVESLRSGQSGSRNNSRAQQLFYEAQYEEALQRALRESVEDEQRRAAKAEKERQEEEKRKAKEEKQRVKDEAKQQKQAEKAAKKTGNLLSFPRAMRSSSSIVSSGRRSSGSIESGKGKAAIHVSSDGTGGLASRSRGASSASNTYLGSLGRDAEMSRSSNLDVPGSSGNTSVTDSRAAGGLNLSSSSSSLSSSVATTGAKAQSQSQSQTNFGSLDALMEKPQEHHQEGRSQSQDAKDESGSGGFSSFGQDMLNSMNDIITGGSSERQGESKLASSALSSPALSSSPTESKRQEVESSAASREIGSV